MTAQARLTLLGTGTLVPNAERQSAAFHLAVGSRRVLVDCGSGALHGMPRHGVDWFALTHVVVSHFHPDHVGDLATLMAAFTYGLPRPRQEPLTLVGPPGFRDFLDRLSALFGDHVTTPGVPLVIREVVPGDRCELDDDVFLVAHPTPHTAESVAYRFESPAGVFGYTGDTGPDDALSTFLQGSDVLVAECGQADPPTLPGHLSPARLAELAATAEPGLLVVTHVPPPLDPLEAVKQIAANGYRGRCVAGFDGVRIAFGGGRVAVDPETAPT